MIVAVDRSTWPVLDVQAVPISLEDMQLAIWFTTAEVPLTRDNVRAGWLALGIVLVMAVGVVVLARSFIKHTKRAAEPWDSDAGE